jgi:hypothetical protein
MTRRKKPIEGFSDVSYEIRVVDKKLMAELDSRLPSETVKYLVDILDADSSGGAASDSLDFAVYFLEEQSALVEKKRQGSENSSRARQKGIPALQEITQAKHRAVIEKAKAILEGSTGRRELASLMERITFPLVYPNGEIGNFSYSAATIREILKGTDL